MAVFCIVAPCNLADRRFRDACCLHHQSDESQYKTEVLGSEPAPAHHSSSMNCPEIEVRFSRDKPASNR
jgi:hypothetical protein